MIITVTDSKEGSTATWTVDSVEKMADHEVRVICTNGKHLEISGLLAAKIAAASLQRANR